MKITTNNRSKYAGSTVTAKKLLKQNGGKWFTILYRKLDGTTRTINARVSSKQFNQGNDRVLIKERLEGYKSIYHENIIKLSVGGLIVDFTDS